MSNLVKMHKQVGKMGKQSIGVKVNEDGMVVMVFSHSNTDHKTEVKLEASGAMGLAKALVEACAFLEAKREIIAKKIAEEFPEESPTPEDATPEALQ